MNKQINLKTGKRNKKYIEKIFHKYTAMYADLMSRHSNLTDNQRLTALNQFQIGYNILEYYYFYRDEVLEKDLLFRAVENILKELEQAHTKYVPKKKNKSTKIKK